MRPNLVRSILLAPAIAALIAFSLMPFAARAGSINYIGSPQGADPASGMTWATASLFDLPLDGVTYPYNDVTTSGATPGTNGQAGFINVDFGARPLPELPGAGEAQAGGTYLGGGQFYALLPLDRPWSQLQLSLDFRTTGLPVGLPTEDAFASFGLGIGGAGFHIGFAFGSEGNLPLRDGWSHVTRNLGAILDPGSTLLDPRGHDGLNLLFNMNAAANYLPTGPTERFEFDNLRIDAVPDAASTAVLIGVALLALGLARRFQR